MALCRTGCIILKCVKPVLLSPSFFVPNSVNFQVRHAARKGYRDKLKRQKKVEKKEPVLVSKEFHKVKKVKFEKTVILKKPEPPTDDVIIRDDFNYKKYSLSEAVSLHREYHHPTVYNNPRAPVNVRFELNMIGKSQFQIMKPFKGIATIPHPFVISHKKEVLVLCNPEDKELALSCGASVAGGADVIEKIQEGVIQPSVYDYVIAHVNFLQNISPIRTTLKDKLPRAKLGTLTNDLKSAIYKFLHGIEYVSLRIGDTDNFGFIHCPIGTIDMELSHLEENLKSLISNVENHRPPREGEFISWIWCSSPPSKEDFCLDPSLYVDTKVKVDIDDELEDTSPDDKEEEKLAAKKLIREYEENEILNQKI